MDAVYQYKTHSSIALINEKSFTIIEHLESDINILEYLDSNRQGTDSMRIALL